jgi:hypothetical protein
VIAHGLETREKLNVFLCILQGVYWRLRESEVKFVEHFVSEVFLKFEGIGTEESQVTLIQDIALCKDVCQTLVKVWIDMDCKSGPTTTTLTTYIRHTHHRRHTHNIHTTGDMPATHTAGNWKGAWLGSLH